MPQIQLEKESVWVNPQEFNEEQKTGGQLELGVVGGL